MTGYSWLGVVISALGTTLAIGSWAVMAMPYFENAPYLTELRRSSKIAFLLGVALFAFFFGIFYLGALHLDQDTSGPLLAFAALVIALPFSLLLGSETWEHFNPKAMNRAPGGRAVAVATGIGLSELMGAILVFMGLLRFS